MPVQMVNMMQVGIPRIHCTMSMGHRVLSTSDMVEKNHTEPTVKSVDNPLDQHEQLTL